jgi:hypothetical protein
MANPSEFPADYLRDETAQLEKMRRQIFSDMETLRTQEQNLRIYEARLRGSGSAAGAPDLDVERDKLNRLRALVEAERRALVDERLSVREEKVLLTQKAEELKKREAWIELRERELRTQSFAPPPKAKPPVSALQAARSLLSLGSKRGSN